MSRCLETLSLPAVQRGIQTLISLRPPQAPRTIQKKAPTFSVGHEARTMANSKSSRKSKESPRPSLTHFLCLPLVTPESKAQLLDSLATFREAVSSDHTHKQINDDEVGFPDQNVILPAIHPKAIRPVGALHCTLGVMSLNAQQLEEAVNLLSGLNTSEVILKVMQDHSIESSQEHGSLDLPLRIDLKGLESMHTPSKTSILYSVPADHTNRLLPFCLALQKLFKDRKLLVSDDRELKLHATIVNTIYAKPRARKYPSRARGSTSGHDRQLQGHGPNANSSMKIDATAILEKFKDFCFAENVTLNRVAICEMGAKKILDSSGTVVAEEYTEVAHIKLPP